MFGGGIGFFVYWGEWFNLNLFLVRILIDSYYVCIWVEIGLVGICLYVFMLGYFLGKGCGIVWYLKDLFLWYWVMVLLVGFFGILVVSYGN